VTLTTGGKQVFAAAEAVPLSAGASCAVGDSPQYRFDYLLDGTGVYVPIQGWQASPAVQWDTTNVHAGKYALRVLARAGSSGTEVSKAVTIWLGNVCNTLTASASAPKSRRH
jgi:hypothetical protein